MSSNPEILCIKSDKKELQKVEKFLFRVFEKKKLPQKYFNKVFLCISEAVVNSIEHGYNSDSQKEVFIKINCFENNICVEVRDKGKGFDFKRLDDPTSEQNLKKETGRGIHIIKSLCSHIEYRNHGKCVKIKIDLK